MRECGGEKPLSPYSEYRRSKQESETERRLEEGRHRRTQLSRLRFLHLQIEMGEIVLFPCRYLKFSLTFRASKQIFYI